uniref:cyclin-dependent kinase n=1 Tax=Davidia involucrata TaxID=16924 RepID=A0A5B7C4E4_DAVIN
MERYRIDGILGDGGFAVVYQATDSITNKTVALKKISLEPDNEIPRNIMREALLLSDLQHENIVRLERVFVYEECIYLVLEYMAMDIRVHMVWKEDKYPGIIKKLLKQMLAGISYCHSQGVLHRDLKPENLLISTRTETLKIADFGFARAFVTPDMTLSPEVSICPCFNHIEVSCAHDK